MLSGPRFSKSAFVSSVGSVGLDESEKKIPHMVWEALTLKTSNSVAAGSFDASAVDRPRQNISHPRIGHLGSPGPRRAGRRIIAVKHPV